MRGIIAWFARNSVAANLLMLMLVAGGLATLPIIQQMSFPETEVEVIEVAVEYPGAAPDEVEQGICIRIEEAIQAIEGIERLVSSSAENACGVTAELLTGYPIDRALSAIKNEVDAITTFPDDAEEPVVRHFDMRTNALQLALGGQASVRTLKELGERVRDEISTLPGVTQVDLASVGAYEISIEVPEASLRRHGITFDDVVAAVRRGSLDRPGGSIRTQSGEVLLRTKGQAYTAAEFERLVVLTRDDGTRLLLGDVATVVDGFEEDAVTARFNGEPAALLRVYRVGDQKILDLVEQVKGYVAEARAHLPDGVELQVWRDGAQGLRDRLSILIKNGVTGFALVFVVLALFMRLRLAFWVALGVPVAFLGSFMLFPVMDLSINLASTFAFIMVLGLLVDDAIVVGENVHRHQQQHEEPLEAAIRGAQEVAVPVVFGVLTTVVAFLPMIFAPGGPGAIFDVIGRVAICCLIFSVVESQWVLPAHLGHMKLEAERGASEMGSRVAQRWKALQQRLARSLETLASRDYGRALEHAIEWRYATLALAVALLMVTGAYIQFGHIKFSFFPHVDSNYVTARLTMPQGTPLAVTRDAVSELETAAWRLKESLAAEYPDAESDIVIHIMSTIGGIPSTGNGPNFDTQQGSGSNLGEVALELASGDARPLASTEVAQRWRDLIPPIPDLEELQFEAELLAAGSDIDIELQSPDLGVLIEAADELKAKLAEYSGAVDIRDSFREGKREIVLSILPAAQTLQLTLDDLASQVRQAFYGAEAQRVQRGRDDIKVMVRYPAGERRSLADLENLRIRTPNGGEVPFYQVARAEPGRGYAVIKRRDRHRVVNVQAGVDAARGNENEILADLQANFLPELIANHPGIRYSLEGTQREQRKTMAGLARNYALAIFAIYALLAIPLRSYAQPLLIMSVIPFGMIGVLVGHLIRGAAVGSAMNFSIMSVFGFVALTGVVVNSSLVLVHYINQRREAGVELGAAVRSAGVARFRPIVLTSLTTFSGLLPLLAEPSVSAQIVIPMATSLGFGVVFATGVSLFVLPCLYVILEDVRGLVAGTSGGESPIVAIDRERERRAS